jgi:hypothetical protein
VAVLTAMKMTLEMRNGNRRWGMKKAARRGGVQGQWQRKCGATLQGTARAFVGTGGIFTENKYTYEHTVK